MINSELHFELADPYLEEEDILWQPRCSHDSSVDSWSLWLSGKAQSLGRSPASTLAQPGNGGTRALSWGGGIVDPSRGNSVLKLPILGFIRHLLCLPSCTTLGTLGKLAKPQFTHPQSGYLHNRDYWEDARRNMSDWVCRAHSVWSGMVRTAGLPSLPSLSFWARALVSAAHTLMSTAR